jgi:hypothetical protein
MTRQEIWKEVFLKSHNKLQKDGRINGGVDSNGLLLAHSISPDYELFESQVEKGIYPVVSALKDMGYFTISSCEGHPYGGIVKIGFGSQQCRDSFIDQLHKSKIEFITFRPHNSCVNMQSEIPSHESTGKIKSERVEFDGGEGYISKLNADCFNFQFGTHFRKWFFLDVNILEQCSWLHPIKKIKVLRGLQKKDNIVQDLSMCIRAGEAYQDVYTRHITSEFQSTTQV